MPEHMPRSPRLSRSVKPADDVSLSTLNDVCGYMEALPIELAQQPVWLDAAALALDARLLPSRTALAALTRQIELALTASTSDELVQPAGADLCQGLLHGKRKPRLGRHGVRPGISMP